jgi:UPF0755 protein
VTDDDRRRAALGASVPEDEVAEDETPEDGYYGTYAGHDATGGADGAEEAGAEEEGYGPDDAYYSTGEAGYSNGGAGLRFEGDDLGPEVLYPGDAVGDEDEEELLEEPGGGDALTGPGEGDQYAGPADRPHDQRQGRRRRRRRRWAVASLVVLVALVIVGVVGYVQVSHDINPTGRPGKVVVVSIPNGASTHDIADVLSRAGVIQGPDVFELYLKLEGAGALLPGTYHLAKNEPYSAVELALEKGPPPLIDKLVVPEGFTIREMATAIGRLHGIGISSQAFMQAATSGQVRSPYEPAGTNSLEGLLFPATYPVEQGESADDLVQYMVDTFDYHAAQLGLRAAAAALHYSPYQVVTVASIIEREAKFDSDRGPIASVIYNRLARGIPIGAESTLLYGLGDPTGPVNVDKPSPYNTLINKGFPPTPISNPGIPSLQAAMQPPHTSYLFWVETNPDGNISFASNQAGFVHLQAECRAVHLC